MEEERFWKPWLVSKLQGVESPKKMFFIVRSLKKIQIPVYKTIIVLSLWPFMMYVLMQNMFTSAVINTL